MNRLTKMGPLLAWVALLGPTCAGAAERPADFAFGMPLTLDTQSAFYRVALPASFYAGSVRANQDDLRVFNADDAMVPYAWLDSPGAVREKRPTTALAMFPLLVDQDATELNGLSLSIDRTTAGRTSVSLTTGNGTPVHGQRLAGYLVDASALREPIAALVVGWQFAPSGMNTRARVESSTDLRQWQTVVGDAPLLDLEYEGRRLVRDRIDLHQLSARYLRISWPSGQTPLQLDSVHAEFSDRALETPRQWTEVAGSRVAEREDEYLFDLGGALPVDRIAIALPELNAVVPAQMSARNAPEEPWRPIASLVSYRLQQDAAEVEAPPTVVPVAAYRYWQLRIDPKSGGIGRGALRMRAGWLPREIVFAARGAAPFVIAYGNATASSTALPVVTLIPGYGGAIEAASIAVAHAGAAAPLGSLEQLKPQREYRRMILWAVLILGVVALGWMAWQLARQLHATPTQSPPDDVDKGA